MGVRTAVIIATKGRPEEVDKLVALLELQTVGADITIVSATGPDDVAAAARSDRLRLIYGAPGLPAQRNRALASIRDAVDFIVFFDDDFIPSRFWIERMHAIFASRPDVAIVTGRVLLDGVLARGIDWGQGVAMVEQADRRAGPLSLKDNVIIENEMPYGCNMAIRVQAVGHLSFDERLVLYGWLEDRDFGIRAASLGSVIWTDAVWGIHLGIQQGGRQSGLRFGYSQIVNPWYLMKKGVLTPYQAGQKIVRGFVGNALGSFFPNPRVDRWGRLKGNLLGIKHIIAGSWAPENVAKL